ncbi:unnamed protein product [Amoebophrya sp. A25]|nr:unnamed protein product [Amoebophrya sp. A25]|eukprot:GSA25T00003758001.1
MSGVQDTSTAPPAGSKKPRLATSSLIMAPMSAPQSPNARSVVSNSSSRGRQRVKGSRPKRTAGPRVAVESRHAVSNIRKRGRLDEDLIEVYSDYSVEGEDGEAPLEQPSQSTRRQEQRSNKRISLADELLLAGIVLDQDASGRTDKRGIEPESSASVSQDSTSSSGFYNEAEGVEVSENEQDKSSSTVVGEIQDHTQRLNEEVEESTANNSLSEHLPVSVDEPADNLVVQTTNNNNNYESEQIPILAGSQTTSRSSFAGELYPPPSSSKEVSVQEQQSSQEIEEQQQEQEQRLLLVNNSKKVRTNPFSITEDEQSSPSPAQRGVQPSSAAGRNVVARPALVAPLEHATDYFYRSGAAATLRNGVAALTDVVQKMQADTSEDETSEGEHLPNKNIKTQYKNSGEQEVLLEGGEPGVEDDPFLSSQHVVPAEVDVDTSRQVFAPLQPQVVVHKHIMRRGSKSLSPRSVSESEIMSKNNTRRNTTREGGQQEQGSARSSLVEHFDISSTPEDDGEEDVGSSPPVVENYYTALRKTGAISMSMSAPQSPQKDDFVLAAARRKSAYLQHQIDKQKQFESQFVDVTSTTSPARHLVQQTAEALSPAKDWLQNNFTTFTEKLKNEHEQDIQKMKDGTEMLSRFFVGISSGLSTAVPSSASEADGGNVLGFSSSSSSSSSAAENEEPEEAKGAAASKSKGGATRGLDNVDNFVQESAFLVSEKKRPLLERKLQRGRGDKNEVVHQRHMRPPALASASSSESGSQVQPFDIEQHLQPASSNRSRSSESASMSMSSRGSSKLSSSVASAASGRSSPSSRTSSQRSRDDPRTLALVQQALKEQDRMQLARGSAKESLLSTKMFIGDGEDKKFQSQHKNIRRTTPKRGTTSTSAPVQIELANIALEKQDTHLEELDRITERLENQALRMREELRYATEQVEHSGVNGFLAEDRDGTRVGEGSLSLGMRSFSDRMSSYTSRLQEVLNLQSDIVTLKRILMLAIIFFIMSWITLAAYLSPRQAGGGTSRAY